ncbi:MAG: hypothetical protein ACM31O_10695 [Bacteroidota bacterium]|jgi:hypothetical protein
MRIMSLLVIIAFAGPAAAEGLHPDLTADQSSRLQAALDAQGCAGGTVRIGTAEFAVSGARCGGDREYDLVFDREYKLLRKDPRG